MYVKALGAYFVEKSQLLKSFYSLCLHFAPMNSSFQYQTKETLPCSYAPSGQSGSARYLRDLSLLCQAD